MVSTLGLSGLVNHNKRAPSGLQLEDGPRGREQHHPPLKHVWDEQLDVREPQKPNQHQQHLWDPVEQGHARTQHYNPLYGR